ncbi:MAG TPA: hypothetical protein VF931_00555 [Steroidobacteraceae bacterium]
MMNIRRFSMTRAAAVAFAIALLPAAGASLAAEPAHMDRAAPSKEMRAKMAGAHEQLAACLRSDRPIAECHEEMMKQHELMGHEMMRHGHDEHEDMDKGDCEHWSKHDHAMGDKPADKPANESTQK